VTAFLDSCVRAVAEEGIRVARLCSFPVAGFSRFPALGSAGCFVVFVPDSTNIHSTTFLYFPPPLDMKSSLSLKFIPKPCPLAF
jgi:hypothetical protein